MSVDRLNFRDALGAFAPGEPLRQRDRRVQHEQQIAGGEGIDGAAGNGEAYQDDRGENKTQP